VPLIRSPFVEFAAANPVSGASLRLKRRATVMPEVSFDGIKQNYLYLFVIIKMVERRCKPGGEAAVMQFG
jgi:hypothetical protein